LTAMPSSSGGTDRYSPGREDAEAISSVYVEFDGMLEDSLQRSFPVLNDRTPKEMIDQSRQRLNSYILPRESQTPKKEPWEANVFTGTTRNKARAFASSVSRNVPDIVIEPRDRMDRDAVVRAEVLKELVRHSFIRYGNPEVDLFNMVWACLSDGTVIVRDTRIVNQGKYREITEWDPVTSKVKFEEKEGVIEDRQVFEILDPMRVLEKDPFCPRIQDQPRIQTVEYMDRSVFMRRFGRYKNAKHVKTASMLREGETDSFFTEAATKRIGKDRVELLMDYSVPEDTYRIVANGVLVFDSPMLWGRKKKIYPFAKAYFEPFSVPFFRGNSLANVMMDFQDIQNALVNSMLNKTFRSVEQPLLVNKSNMQSFELSDEWVTQDRRIYVDDINGVKPMPVGQITDGEVRMLDYVGQELSLSSSDALKQGVSGSGSTAREIVIANENSDRMMGLFYTMIKDLWLQMVRIRSVSTLMTYAMPHMEGKKRAYPSHTIPKAKLSTGETGTLEIRISDRATIDRKRQRAGVDESGREFNRIDVEEERARMETGNRTEILYVPPDYLDDFTYDIDIMTASLARSGRALDMAMAEEKMLNVAKLFPQKFQENSDVFFADFMRQYNDNPDKYSGSQPSQTVPQAMPGAQGGQSQLAQQIMSPTQSLPNLSTTSV